MGNISSRVQQRFRGARDDEEGDGSQINKFSSRSGDFFGTHFLMGGERFELSQPEAFLFGDNSDLDFLGTKPVMFPYVQQSNTDPTRTLNALINIRRDSIKFVKIKIADETQIHPLNEESTDKYRIEFVFDCDSACSLQILFFAREAISANGGITYVPKAPELCSRKFAFEIGSNQTFNDFVFDPKLFNVDQMRYDPENDDEFPVVIHCEAHDYDVDETPQSHATLAVVERSAEGHGYILKPLKQKLFVHGVCYLLQEIYGIENKNVDQENDDMCPSDENGSECIVCMSDMRDTVILPCRHLCLCNACAETLRYKASNCPICRSPFRALLQLKTMRLLSNSAPALSVEADGTHRQVTRYETLPLVEALNGPIDHTQTCVTTVPSNMHPVQQPHTTHPHPAHLIVSHSDSELAHTRPPRGGRRRKQQRPIAPIQEVLTPTGDGAVELEEYRPSIDSKQELSLTRQQRPISLIVNEVDECPEEIEADGDRAMEHGQFRIVDGAQVHLEDDDEPTVVVHSVQQSPTSETVEDSDGEEKENDHATIPLSPVEPSSSNHSAMSVASNEKLLS
uniref:RING-type E3 ubiquitin transferase n=1 Tax=Plectus sambesii TaxID=2011161 RepID=A0A914WFP7_9BILA